MYSLLVVDDEKYALQGITQGIEWSMLDIENVYEANSAAKAQKLMDDGTMVDIVIADIEMPGQSGLELVEWLNDHYPDTQVVFFTGHASFDYAREAIRLGGVGYLLKPVDHEELKRSVRQAIDKVNQIRGLRASGATVERYSRLWEAQKPLLVERFWQNILDERKPWSVSSRKEACELYNVPLHDHSKLLPVLISIESWSKEFSARDEEIMEFAIQKASDEVVLGELAGHVIRDRSGSILILHYRDDEPDESLREEIRNSCDRFLDVCRDYFYCSVSCYIGQAVTASELRGQYGTLLNRERNNLRRSNSVIEDMENEEEEKGVAKLPLVLEWLPLMERNESEELLARLEETFLELKVNAYSAESLATIRHGLLHALYYVTIKKGLSIPNLYEAKGGPDRVLPECRSLQHLEEWSRHMVTGFMDSWKMASDSRPSSESVEQAKRFIRANLQEEMTREQIAENVFLNPAYLSRLFKREVGLTLSDYIQQMRMELAQRLLRESDLKIGEIVEKSGYSHLSHFAKLFKRIVGMGPHEYRKLYGRTENSPI